MVAGDFNDDWRQQANLVQSQAGLEDFTRARGRPARTFRSVPLLSAAFTLDPPSSPEALALKHWRHLPDTLPLAWRYICENVAAGKVNRITLLENGDQLSALSAAYSRASRRVILESFIWFEDGWAGGCTGPAQAARRGTVEVLLDGMVFPGFQR